MPTHRVSPFDAAYLQDVLQRACGHEQVKVRPYGGHLIVEMHVGDEVYKVARLTSLPRQEYGLSYRTASEKWERMPFCGSLDEMASAITELLRPYLDPASYVIL